jgi:hypothetical protein
VNGNRAAIASFAETTAGSAGFGCWADRLTAAAAMNPIAHAARHHVGLCPFEVDVVRASIACMPLLPSCEWLRFRSYSQAFFLAMVEGITYLLGGRMADGRCENVNRLHVCDTMPARRSDAMFR